MKLSAHPLWLRRLRPVLSARLPPGWRFPLLWALMFSARCRRQPKPGALRWHAPRCSSAWLGGARRLSAHRHQELGAGAWLARAAALIGLVVAWVVRARGHGLRCRLAAAAVLALQPAVPRRHRRHVAGDAAAPSGRDSFADNRFFTSCCRPFSRPSCWCSIRRISTPG